MVSRVSDRTAIEIVSNPRDLLFSVAEDTTFLISRGPGHNFKLLLDGKFGEGSTKKEVIEWIEAGLLSSIENVKKELNNQGSIIATMLNPDKKPAEEANILSEETIKKIVRDLKLKGVAKTYSES